MFGALKRGFRSMASLILVRNVVGELRPKRTLAASRGFLAVARLSCLLFCSVLHHCRSTFEVLEHICNVCAWVFVCITCLQVRVISNYMNVGCRLSLLFWRAMNIKFGHAKFCKIKSCNNQNVENFMGETRPSMTPPSPVPMRPQFWTPSITNFWLRHWLGSANVPGEWVVS